MTAAFLITLREGLEAALVVAIVMAYLRQLGRPDQFAPVAAGAIAGVVVAIVAGAAIYIAVGELEGRAEQLTEGSIALAAVAVLTWMIFWMRAQARSLGGHLRSEVDQALRTGTLFGLASIVFIGVVREGLETALFMLTIFFDFGIASSMIGAVAGLALAIALGYALYRGGQMINLRTFFQITGGLLILFAAGLLGRGIHELQEANVFDSLYSPVWDVADNAVVGDGHFADFLKSLFGWSPEPTLEQFVAWAAFLAIAAWLFYSGHITGRVTRVWNGFVRMLPSPFGEPLAAEADCPTNQEG